MAILLPVDVGAEVSSTICMEAVSDCGNDITIAENSSMTIARGYRDGIILGIYITDERSRTESLEPTSIVNLVVNPSTGGCRGLGLKHPDECLNHRKILEPCRGCGTLKSGIHKMTGQHNNIICKFNSYWK